MLDVISKTYMLLNLLSGIINLILSGCLLVLFIRYSKKQKHLKQGSTQQIPIVTPQNEIDLMTQNMHQRLNQLRYGTFSPIKSQSSKRKLP